MKELQIGEGNGWTEVYSPSNVNKELLKINPDTQQTYLEDIHDELSEMRYEQEVMANFGEELAQGKTSEVLNNPEVIKAYIGG
jgi:ABC-type branched-subunit amino acid transport system ATPase component